MHLKQKIGKYGEDLAEKFLVKNGYKILDKSWQTRFAEIDLVASQGETIIFIEVKTRTSLACGNPEDSVDWRKIGKIKTAAKSYIQYHNIIDKDLRIDCVSIELNLKESRAKIRHHKNIGF